MTDFLRSMASSDGFMPHGMCYLWEPELLWLHFTADFLTGLAYWAIPPVLLFLVVKARREFDDEDPLGHRGLPYDWMFVAFGAFIVACGATHFMEVWTIWNPRYWLSGGVKAVTAAASVATAIALPPLVPRALDLVRDARDSELRRRQLESANRDLEELSRQLREANRLQTELVANVSHELRTPLTLILGPADELGERDDLPEEVGDALDLIGRNARSLLGQVDDLLDVARLDLETLELERREIDVAELLDDTLSHFRPLARRAGIDLEWRTPESLVCRLDPGRVERVVLNLISNALKFTPEGGRVRCLLELEKGSSPGSEEVGTLALEVRDSGPGVPEEKRDEIFRRFRRGDGGESQENRGVGLGLAITRELVELHGGTIEVDDAPEGGARFRVRIPVDGWTTRRTGVATAGATGAAPLEAARVEAALGSGDDAPRTVARTPEEPDDDRAGRILLVEDDADLRGFLARLLRRHYRVETASDGLEALERLDREAPDLVLTDVMMPRMDGEELLAEIRRRPDGGDVPVVVLTARAEPDLAARLLRAGARDYLMKPVTVEELQARIGTHMEQILGRRILQRELASREEDLGALAGEAARRKRALEESLEQKDVLVRELHHRVKGNLQTVSSLLNLQIRRTEDDGARQVLRESRGRIGAMAVLHEKLYQTDDPTRTRMDGYLRSLLRDVSHSWAERGGPVRVETEVDPVVLEAERAVTCGLLVHELVSNAFRHAFPGDTGGVVRVRMRDLSQEGRVRIEVADDGAGLPETVDPDEPETLGLGLVRSLVDQLGGTLELRRGEGTAWRISFPLDAPPTERGRPA